MCALCRMVSVNVNCQLHTLVLFEKKASSDQTEPWGTVLIISYCRKAQSTMESTLPQEVAIRCVRKLTEHGCALEETS